MSKSSFSKSHQTDWFIVIPKPSSGLEAAVQERLVRHCGLTLEEARQALEHTPLVLLDNLQKEQAEKIQARINEKNTPVCRIQRDSGFRKKCSRITWDEEEMLRFFPPMPLPEKDPLQILETKLRELQESLDLKTQALAAREEAVRQEKAFGEKIQALLEDERRQWKVWMAETEHAQSKMNALEFERNRLDIELKKKLAEMEAWNTGQSRLDEAKNRLDRQLEEKVRALEESRAAAEALRRELEGAREVKDRLLKEVEELRRHEKEMASALETATRAKNGLSQKAGQMEIRLAELEKKGRDAEEFLKTSSDELARLKSKLEQTEASNERLTAEKKTQLEQQEKNLAEQSTHLEKLQKENQPLRAVQKEAQEISKTRAEDVRRWQGTIEDLNRQGSEARASLEQALKEKEILSQTQEQLQKENQQLREVSAKSLEKAEGLEKRAAELERSKFGLEAVVKNMQTNLTEYEEKVRQRAAAGEEEKRQLQQKLEERERLYAEALKERDSLPGLREQLEAAARRKAELEALLQQAWDEKETFRKKAEEALEEKKKAGEQLSAAEARCAELDQKIGKSRPDNREALSAVQQESLQKMEVLRRADQSKLEELEAASQLMSEKYLALEAVKNEFVTLLASEKKRYEELHREYEILRERLETQVLRESVVHKQEALPESDSSEESARIERLKLILDLEDHKDKPRER